MMDVQQAASILADSLTVALGDVQATGFVNRKDLTRAFEVMLKEEQVTIPDSEITTWSP